MLLSRHPEGLSADHLAMLLDDKDLDVVTIRAEMSRLRKVVGSEFIASRPYRLLSPLTSDLGAVFDALAAGDVASALDGYRGQLLSQSVSPAIARLRTELAKPAQRSARNREALHCFGVGSDYPKVATTATAGGSCTTAPNPSPSSGRRPVDISPAWTSNSASSC